MRLWIGPGSCGVRRVEFAQAVRRASEITGDRDIVVLGSQSVHGAFNNVLPRPTVDSMEVDVLALHDETGDKSWDLLGRAGEGSGFHQIQGIHLDGVDIKTSTLPKGWVDRLIPFVVDDPSSEPIIAWCLEPHDLVVAKAVAGRDKDHAFIKAMAHGNLIDPREAISRSRMLDPGCAMPRPEALERACAYLAALPVPPHLYKMASPKIPCGRRRPRRDEFPEAPDMWADMREQAPTLGCRQGRSPTGIPTDGQFLPNVHPEPTFSLDAPPDE